MCMLKIGTRFYSVDGKSMPTPSLPTLPNEWAIEFEVKDTKSGRSAVAKALNHGNSRLPFSDIREEAANLGWVTRPRHFQGLAFSDAPVDGTERYLISLPDKAPCHELFQIMDYDHGGAWHVFPLSLGFEPELLPETASGFATQYHEGQGFLMKSCNEGLVFAIYHEETEDEPAFWHVYGGGGSVYLHFLEEALKDARHNQVLLYEA